MKILDQIHIVLVRPQSGGNIGSTARAMKNMSLRKLVLVSPARDWRREAKMMAMNAGDVLGRARVVETLNEAVRDASFIVGTTRRGGEGRSPQELNETSLQLIMEKAREGEVAILFGNERIGLSGHELSITHMNLTIPASVRQPSLNLSHAVMILAYELFRASGSRKLRILRKDERKYRATEADLDEMCLLLRPALEKLGYRNGLKRDFLDHLLLTIKATAKKSRFEIRDVRMIEGVAGRILNLARPVSER